MYPKYAHSGVVFFNTQHRKGGHYTSPLKCLIATVPQPHPTLVPYPPPPTPMLLTIPTSPSHIPKNNSLMIPPSYNITGKSPPPFASASTIYSAKITSCSALPLRLTDTIYETISKEPLDVQPPTIIHHDLLDSDA